MIRQSAAPQRAGQLTRFIDRSARALHALRPRVPGEKSCSQTVMHWRWRCLLLRVFAFRARFLRSALDHTGESPRRRERLREHSRRDVRLDFCEGGLSSAYARWQFDPPTRIRKPLRAWRRTLCRRGRHRHEVDRLLCSKRVHVDGGGNRKSYQNRLREHRRDSGTQTAK